MDSSYLTAYGYSYAFKVGYKPKAFERIEKTLVHYVPKTDEKEIVFKDRKLVEQIIDSYGKLGFLFLARDAIQKVNGRIPLSHIYVHYHLYNFIYDCKAFLDAVALMLNDFYSIGETRGNIDLKHCSFRNMVIKKEPKLASGIKEHKDWFTKVASWRDDLIHRFSSPIAPFLSLDHWPTDNELNRFLEAKPPCEMFIQPHPYLSGVSELQEEYGRITQEIEPFCQEWIMEACEFYDQVCDAISEGLHSQGRP